MNKNKLISVIAEHGENQGILAAALGMSRVTFSRKISENGEAAFTQPEISAIKKRYNLTCEQIDEIFFAD